MRSQTLTKSAKSPSRAAISAADYFWAKLNYETTAWSLKKALEEKNSDIYLLDVRSADQYSAGHIPGAKNIPLQDLVSQLKTLPKGKTIVTYCGSITCSLAPKAALELAEKGFRVKELFGGIQDWEDKGFPIER